MNILFTSVGRRSYLLKYFRESMCSADAIYAANSIATTPAFRVADNYVVTPLIYSEEYIPFLLSYCNEHSIDVIVSLFDVDLYILAQNKQAFENIGVRVIVSDPHVIEVCNDKWRTHQFLKDKGLNSPKTFLDINAAKNAIAKKELNYPFIIKPRWGMGSIGIVRANNERELDVLYNKVMQDIQSTYLKYESSQDVSRSVLIQESVDGIEYGLDVINDLEANYVTSIVKKKIAMRAGETDCAVTVDNKELAEIGKKLSCSLKHIANLDVDLICKDKQYYVLDMNARFGGGYPFSHAAGVDLPKAILGWLKGDMDQSEFLQAKTNVMAQKDIDIVVI